MSRFVAIADTRPINVIGVIGPINSIELEFPKIHTLIMNGYQVYGLTGPGGQRTEKLNLYNYMDVTPVEAAPVEVKHEESEMIPNEEQMFAPESEIAPVTEPVVETPVAEEVTEPVTEEVVAEPVVEETAEPVVETPVVEATPAKTTTTTKSTRR